MLIAGGADITRDIKTGLYVVGGEMMTLAQYEDGQRVLALREKAHIMGGG